MPTWHSSVLGPRAWNFQQILIGSKRRGEGREGKTQHHCACCCFSKESMGCFLALLQSVWYKKFTSEREFTREESGEGRVVDIHQENFFCLLLLLEVSIQKMILLSFVNCLDLSLCFWCSKGRWIRSCFYYFRSDVYATTQLIGVGIVSSSSPFRLFVPTWTAWSVPSLTGYLTRVSKRFFLRLVP